MLATEPTKLLIEPNTLRMIGQRTQHARRIFTFDDTALEYTDRALLAYCGYTPEFGGKVDRLTNAVQVHVYTD